MILNKATRTGRSFLLVGLSALIAVVLIAVPSFAQNDSTPPKWDFFAGYQYLGPGATVPAVTNPQDPNNPVPFHLPGMAKGIGGAVAYNLDAHWAMESDFGYSRDTGSGSSEWTIGGGPRFMWRTDTANLFLHAIGAFNRVSYDNGFATHNGIGIILGGGIDVPINKLFTWRLIGADYVWAQHNFASLAAPQFSSLRRPEFEGARLRTGVVLNWGGAPAVAPAAACSVTPTEVLVGEPIQATVTASNFNPKHTVAYAWSGNGGGTVTGKDTAASIDTNGVAPGNYSVTAKVTDPKSSKNNEASCSANYTVKPLPPKNPPTMSLSASPSSLVTGGSVNLTANCTSPDGVPVSVANWTSSAGSVSGNGTSATLNTSGAPAGPVTVTATCTDSRGLTAQGSSQVTLENPPPPPVDKALEARLSLHSVYFPTALPSEKDPSGGLVASQEKTLASLAADFLVYVKTKPDAHLILAGHADPRGSVQFNQALSERRVERVKSYLVQHGVDAGAIETKAEGDQHNLTAEEVKASVEANPSITKEERARTLRNMRTIILASNRRVDVTLSTTGEVSQRQFPFNAEDALTLIGGRTPVKKAAPATKKPAAKKK